MRDRDRKFDHLVRNRMLQLPDDRRAPASRAGEHARGSRYPGLRGVRATGPRRASRGDRPRARRDHYPCRRHRRFQAGQEFAGQRIGRQHGVSCGRQRRHGCAHLRSARRAGGGRPALRGRPAPPAVDRDRGGRPVRRRGGPRRRRGEPRRRRGELRKRRQRACRCGDPDTVRPSRWRPGSGRHPRRGRPGLAPSHGQPCGAVDGRCGAVRDRRRTGAHPDRAGGPAAGARAMRHDRVRTDEDRLLPGLAHSSSG